ncbi:MAG: heparan-alpha-glucosaminide N-acetyltransferase domain-containing protein, partial [Candidatus Aenigmarchaeota archaeon]|nr:heparan-alpha-glucosaminide N-acetyltransferase domain-containing protein [Candidatus Aenigmarchaeota archaeon]
YFPILPWFGVILIGIFFGNKLYPNAKRSFNIIDLSKFRIIKLLSFLGRHSLFIYLLHQPVIIIIVNIFIL